MFWRLGFVCISSTFSKVMYKDLWIVHLLIETIVSGFVEIMSMFEKEQSLMNRFLGGVDCVDVFGICGYV